MEVILLFLFGAAIGSFLNVVIVRHEKGETLKGFSHCPTCGKTLKAYELVPILSFLVIGGACRGCRGRISWQYPIVEILTGVLFVGLYDVLVPRFFPTLYWQDILPYVYYAAIFSLLIVISVYDLRTKIIPDRFSFLFGALAFAGLYIDPATLVFHIPTLIDFFAGPIFFIPFYALWLFSNGTWIGLGDGKLVLGIGWFLGASGGLSAIMLAFWIGAVVGLLLLCIGSGMEAVKHMKAHQKPGTIKAYRAFHKIARRLGLTTITIKSEIPFGPFLVLGTALVFFYGINIMEWLYTFS